MIQKNDSKNAQKDITKNNMSDPFLAAFCYGLYYFLL